MRIAIVLVCLVACCGFAYLAFINTSLVSFLAFLASFSALLTSVVNLKKPTKAEKSITQSIGNGSFGIQAGNDVNINKSKE